MTKPKMLPPTPQQLADEHWSFLESILLEAVRMEMMLYKSAFLHGYKHGKESHAIRNRKPSK